MSSADYFSWRLVNRQGTWYADGRSNKPSAGRHSLGVTDEAEARRLLPQLDRQRAETLGIAPPSVPVAPQFKALSLAEGRKLYEQHIGRPLVTGGTQKSTQDRYRPVFNKFIPFATHQGVTTWNGVTAKLLTAYAAHLEEKGYAHKTLLNELTTIIQAVNWMIEAEHLVGMKPIHLKLRPAECEPAYCYRPAEIDAMIKHCRSKPELTWMLHIIVALACTGLRIGELLSLRWTNLDLDKKQLMLTDETGRVVRSNRQRRRVKNGRSRTFPIHHQLLEVLKAVPRIDGFVFHGARQKRLMPDFVRKAFVRDVIEPLSPQFPTDEGEKGFNEGRFHSFRHYFCSACANNGVPERMVMNWLGHSSSEMIRHYYHLHDDEAQRRMNQVNFLGGDGGRSADEAQEKLDEEVVEPGLSENEVTC